MRFIYILAALAVTILALAAAASAADDTPKAAETRKKLKQKITVDFNDTSLQDAVDLIKEQMPGLGIRLEAGSVSRNSKVTFKAKDRPLADVLDGMLKKNEYGYVIVSKNGDAYDGTITIKPGKERGYALDEMPAKADGKADAKTKETAKTTGKKAPAPKKTEDAPKKTEDPPVSDPEHDAARKLQQAKEILKDGKKERAKERLQDIVTKYPDTKAAEEAKQLLKDLEP